MSTLGGKNEGASGQVSRALSFFVEKKISRQKRADSHHRFVDVVWGKKKKKLHQKKSSKGLFLETRGTDTRICQGKLGSRKDKRHEIRKVLVRGGASCSLRVKIP